MPDLNIRLDGTVLEVDATSAREIATLNRRVLQVLFDLGVGVLEVRLGHSLEQAYLEQRARSAAL